MILAWGVTGAIVPGVRTVLPAERQRRGGGFVGQTCVVRTGRVDREFGLAEISGGGPTSLIEVRTVGEERLISGSTALILDQDAAAGVYRVTPFGPELDPGSSD